MQKQLARIWSRLPSEYLLSPGCPTNVLGICMFYASKPTTNTIYASPLYSIPRPYVCLAVYETTSTSNQTPLTSSDFPFLDMPGARLLTFPMCCYLPAAMRAWNPSCVLLLISNEEMLPNKPSLVAFST